MYVISWYSFYRLWKTVLQLLSSFLILELFYILMNYWGPQRPFVHMGYIYRYLLQYKLNPRKCKHLLLIHLKITVSPLHINKNNIIFMKVSVFFKTKPEFSEKGSIVPCLRIPWKSGLIEAIWILMFGENENSVAMSHCCSVTHLVASGKVHCIPVRDWE